MSDFIEFEQIPFGSDSFADNPEPRCPCILLLDTSGSMAGKPINQLNEGIRAFHEELLNDPLAKKRVEIAIVTFGPVKIESDFHTVPNFLPQDLEANGDTPIGIAIITAIELLNKRKNEYKTHGHPYYKPWIFLITDGAATDNYIAASELVKDGESKNSFAFFAIGVEGANMSMLKQISVREPLKLQGLKFVEFFKWLSASMKMVSSKNPGSNINMLPPSGWAQL